jgi:hypothetical protein
MLQSFKEFVNNGAFLNTAWTGFDNQTFGTGHALNLPTPTLDIPTKRIESRIRSIFYTQNPINIALEDGTSWKVTKEQWDYLVATGKEPREGKLAQIELFLDGTIRSVNFS